MTMFRKICILLVLFSAVLLNGGCITKSISQKGNMFDDDDLSNISTGLTNRENTLRYLGYPLNKSYFNDDVWIYYSYKMKEVLFFKPAIRDQKVLLIEFDRETDIIKNMTLYTIDSDKFKVLQDTSVTDEKKENLIKDILKNIGQVSM